MSMKMVCNRCNKVKEDGESFDRIDYTVKSVNPYKDFTYDLCPECSKLFSMFLDGGEVEEDRYKDSKPCSVVIHKLASGHYAIENDLRVAKEFAEAGKLENLEEEIVRLPDGSGVMVGELPAMDKEESDLSVKMHKVTCPTTGETVTVPDSEPWSSFEGRKKDKTERCFG